MADYIGMECPGCKQTFQQNDDIVVCPVCGTPQHRSCWMKETHCVNEPLHEKGYVWKAPEAKESSQEAEGQTQAICPYCHSSNKEGTLFCSHCGRSLGVSNTSTFHGQPGGAPVFGGQPGGYPGAAPFGGYSPGYASLNPDEEIDGVKVSKLVEYIQINPGYYVNKFRVLAKKGKKISFNWPCFFLSYIWWFARKNYLMGVLTSIIQIVFMFLTLPYNNQLLDFYSKLPNNPNIITEAYPVMLKFMAIYGILIVINFIFALFANHIYKKQVYSGIYKLDGMKLSNEEHKYFLYRKGGMSFLYGVLSYVGLQLLANLILILADSLLQLL